MAFYRDGRKKGSFDTGIQLALRRLLASPTFVFRVEDDPAAVAAGTAYRVSDVELASRLSFFLWSSMPDDALLDLAAAGRLRQPAVLEAQVRRMLADPRPHALVENFAGPVAAPPQPAEHRAQHRRVPRLRQRPARRLPARDRAVLRQHHARGPQRPGPDDAPTTRSSTSGSPGTTACPTSTAASSAASR